LTAEFIAFVKPQLGLNFFFSKLADFQIWFKIWGKQSKFFALEHCNFFLMLRNAFIMGGFFSLFNLKKKHQYQSPFPHGFPFPFGRMPNRQKLLLWLWTHWPPLGLRKGFLRVIQVSPW